MSSFDLVSFADERALAETAAREWLAKVETARREGQPHFVALSGGRIARTFFSAVAEYARAQRQSLGHVHFFWADERCVSPQDPESNFAVAENLLFRPLGLRVDHVHRIRGEDDPEKTALFAADELRRIVPCDAAGQPVLDLIFLGMGEDGHVASLFPSGQCARVEPAVSYQTVVAPKPPPRRITITFSMIHNAREVWVMVSGAGKEVALKNSLKAHAKTPLGAVIQMRERTRVFTDIHLQEPPG